MIRSLAACALLACATSSDCAETAPESSPPPRAVGGHGGDPALFLAQFDADGEGRVSREAFERFRRARFAQTDQDGDGSVDVEEYVEEFADRLDVDLDAARARQIEQTRARFAAIDANGDGFIDADEYTASGERAFTRYLSMVRETAERSPRGRRDVLRMPTTHSREGMLALYDADGDGRVGREEFDRARMEAFSRTDANGDGRLDLGEYLAEYEDRLDRHIAVRRQSALDQARVRFDALDTDKDGRVSWAEYAASGERMFARADVDGDGVVDAADVAAAADGSPGQRLRAAR